MSSPATLRRRSRPTQDLAAAARTLQREAVEVEASPGAGSPTPETPKTPKTPPPPPPQSPVSPRSPTTPVGPLVYVELPPDPLDSAIQLVEQRPSALAVVVLMPTAMIYLAIWSIMPKHWHRKHPMMSSSGPSACVAVIAVCVYWIVNEINDPACICGRKVPVRPPARAYDEQGRALVPKPQC